MEKVKHHQRNGYDYQVFYAKDGCPAGMMYMTLYQTWQFLCYSVLVSLDWQLKRKNTYGWVFFGPDGTNNNKYLVHCAHSFMIADLIGFVEFHLTPMTEISGRSMKDIKVIAMYGKIWSQIIPHISPSYVDHMPTIFCTQRLWLIFLIQTYIRVEPHNYCKRSPSLEDKSLARISESK